MIALIILMNLIKFSLQIGWIFAFLVVISFWNEEIKMIVICVQIICIGIQLFCWWRIDQRIKYWKELREEVKEMFERGRADFFENMVKEKLN